MKSNKLHIWKYSNSRDYLMVEYKVICSIWKESPEGETLNEKLCSKHTRFGNSIDYEKASPKDIFIATLPAKDREFYIWNQDVLDEIGF